MSRFAAVVRRLLFASAAVTLLAGGPPAPMTLAHSAALPVRAHGPSDVHATRHPPAQAPHHGHTECCDLCVMHCGAAFAPAATAGVSAAAVRAFDVRRPVHAALGITPPRYRLPPALAPPTLLG